MEQTISVFLLIVAIYLALGVLFAIAFLRKGITKVDEGAAGTSWIFKLLIFPGTVALWIFLLPKWLKA